MKAILVIDMPKKCDDCPLMFENDCGVTQTHMQLVWKLGEIYYPKPSWCPLRPLPQKIDISEDELYEKQYMCFEGGWNACIDEILGE